MADTITLTSTTDDESQVRAALALPAVEEPPVEVPPPKPVKPVEPSPSEEPEEEEAPAVDAPVDQMAGARKKRGRLQSRIDELTQERNRVAAERATEKAENEALRRRVAELAGGAAPQRPAAGARRIEKAPAPPPRPAVDEFATYEDYTEAVAKWAVKIAKSEWQQETTSAVDERLKAEADKALQAQWQQTQAALTQRYQAGVIKAREKYDDYDEAIAAPELQASPLMEAELLRSDIGPEITYYLATHPETCKKLHALGNSPQALREFGKVEARVEHALEKAAADKGSQAAAAPTAARSDAAAKQLASVAPPAGPKRVTKAPDPITPVGGGETQATTDPDKMSYQEYKEYMNARERQRFGIR